MTERFYGRLLGLEDGWVVSGVTADIHKGEVLIEVKCLLKEFTDPDTQDMCRLYDHVPMRRWRHLDTMQYKTYICCSLPRMMTPSGKVVTVAPCWAAHHERHTHLFEIAVIATLQATCNQSRTASLMRCGFNIVNRVLHRSTERGMARRRSAEYSLPHLSIDEKSFRKGHDYVTVLSDPTSGHVIDVGQGRTKESCRQLLDTALTDSQRAEVRTVSLDMWKAFMNTVSEVMPAAEQVHDRFHLIKYLNDAVDKVRRREVKKHEELRKSRYALLKNPENLTEKQRIKFDSIRAANLSVASVWQARENFKALFGSSTAETFHLYMRWAGDAANRHVAELDKVVQMFNSHIKGVINTLSTSFSNAMAERLNGKIQLLKSVGRGYRTFDNFRSAILFFHGGLDLYPLKSW